jgi:transposase
MPRVRQVETAVELGKPSQRWFAELERQFNGDITKGTNPPTAPTLLDKTIADCRATEVPEITTLGKTLLGWRTEILKRHLTGASTDPTEAQNLLIK